MSLTINDVLLDVSYRRGENGIPPGNEQARRIKFVGQAYRDLIRQNDFWFLVTTDATSTSVGQEIYPLPKDFKQMLEVRVDRRLRVPQADTTIFNVNQYPPVSYPLSINYFNSAYYFLYGDEIHLLPFPSQTPTPIEVTSISISGIVATVICATDHGLANNDYVEIKGASESECNGSKRVSVLNSNSFTFIVENGTSDPTGTISATWNNFVMRYYFIPKVTFTSLSDKVCIPERYSDALSAYVFGRLAQLDGERGDASDGFEEYNQIVEEMNKENFSRANVDTPLSESIW